MFFRRCRRISGWQTLYQHDIGVARLRGLLRREAEHQASTPCPDPGRVGIDAPAELRGVTQQPIEGTSLVYSFDKPDSPSAKDSQYFEIVGHRGIWHHGWKAVTWHRPGTSFDDDGGATTAGVAARTAARNRGIR